MISVNLRFFSLRALMGSRTLNDDTTMRVPPKDLGVLETCLFIGFPSQIHKSAAWFIVFSISSRGVYTLDFVFQRSRHGIPMFLDAGRWDLSSEKASTKTCSFLCYKMHVLKKHGFTKEFNHPYCFRICGCGTRWQAMSSYVLPWMMRISWRFWSLTVDRNGVRVVFLKQ